MTAAHVVAALDRVSEVRSRARVEARGDRVVFTLSSPNARFDLVLTLAACSVTLQSGGKLLGTGPFMFATDSVPAAPRLVRNPRYRAPVAVNEITFPVLPVDAEGKPPLSWPPWPPAKWTSRTCSRARTPRAPPACASCSSPPARPRSCT